MSEHYELISITADMQQGADFCFVMSGDEMEPVIKQGARVYVSRREGPAQMEAGLFYIDGNVYCRQYCEDYAGNIHLLCSNPKCENMNLRLGKQDKCICLGKVLLREKPPAPIYL